MKSFSVRKRPRSREVRMLVNSFYKEKSTLMEETKKDFYMKRNRRQRSRRRIERRVKSVSLELDRVTRQFQEIEDSYDKMIEGIDWDSDREIYTKGSKMICKH